MVVPGDSYEAVVVKDARGKLGFTVRREAVDGGAALVVSSVVAGGPACRAGVAYGSLLLAVDGTPVASRGADPWAVLGVDRAADAADIKRAWRDKVLRMHPDKGGDSASWLRLQRAFHVLRHAPTREAARTADRVGAGADWALALNLMKAAATTVTLALHLPAHTGARSASSVDFDDHRTASPERRARPPAAADASDDVGAAAYRRAPADEAAPEPPPAAPPFACLAHALTACYGGGGARDDDDDGRPVEFDGGVDEVPLAWRVAAVDAPPSPPASPPASPPPPPPPPLSSPAPLRCLLDNADSLEANLRSQLDVHARAAAIAEAGARAAADDARDAVAEAERLERRAARLGRLAAACRDRGPDAPWGRLDEEILALSRERLGAVHVR